MDKFSDQKKASTSQPKHSDTDNQQVNTAQYNTPLVVAEKTSKAAAPVTTTAPAVNAKADALKNKWKTRVSAAKSNWGKLSTSELLKSDGDAKILAELVHLRYAIPLVEANKQVQRFLEKPQG
jgi:hypothetical protein